MKLASIREWFLSNGWVSDDFEQGAFLLLNPEGYPYERVLVDEHNLLYENRGFGFTYPWDGWQEVRFCSVNDLTVNDGVLVW